MDPKVQEALALLRQAGRLDLVNVGALAPGRLARHASAGVAAAVAVCSSPRPSDGAQVRMSKGRALREAGLGASRAGPLDFGEEDPGEQGAALVPWEEVKAGR
ncbi:hypothetical protein NDU88_003273 [Pleurodeles waltl]|uniref:Uncharacterized protein n=1 Tax=Pleurodeles waltl TaxID=8319 RepID=A0AAV7L3H9_PLEWA|nr:hypothetical protein NDU88_003273 [Pleurodeles waltl]